MEVNFYRREVAKDMRERTEVVDKWREVTLFQGPRLTLPIEGRKMGLSTPSSQEFQSLVGFNYFLLHKGCRAGVFSVLLQQRIADFIQVLQNFEI